MNTFDGSKSLTFLSYVSEQSSRQPSPYERSRARTYVLRLLDKFRDHGLDDSDVAIEGAAKESTKKSKPDVGGEAQNQHTNHGSEASHQQYGFAADAI